MIKRLLDNELFMLARRIEIEYKLKRGEGTRLILNHIKKEK